MSFWTLFLAAAVAGLMGALNGVGGGLVLIPILTMLGVDIREAIAISSVSVVAISNSAAPTFLRRHLPNMKACARLEFFAIAGALVGAVLTAVTNRRVLFVFCGSLLLMSWIALWRTWRRTPPTSATEEAAVVKDTMLAGSYYDSDSGKTIVYEGRRSLPGGLCMLGVGLMAGLLGGGGGAFTVLVVDLVMGFPTKVALAMSNLMMGTIALASLSIYLETGLVNVRLMIPSVLGVLVGALVGAKLLWRLRGPVIRHIFLVVMAILGVEMVYNGVTLFR